TVHESDSAYCLKTAAWLFAFGPPAWKLPTIAPATAPPMSNRPASQIRPRCRAAGRSSRLAPISIPRRPYRKSRKTAANRLLLQPHGFEGGRSVLVIKDVNDLVVPQLNVRVEANVSRDSADLTP